MDSGGFGQNIYTAFSDPRQSCWTNHGEERGRDREADPMSQYKLVFALCRKLPTKYKHNI